MQRVSVFAGLASQLKAPRKISRSHCHCALLGPHVDPSATSRRGFFQDLLRSEDDLRSSLMKLPAWHLVKPSERAPLECASILDQCCMKRPIERKRHRSKAG